MRNICLSFLLAASLANISCEKEERGCVCDITSPDGKYELRKQTGGFAGATVTYAAGNGNALLFENGTYKQFTNGQLSKSGSYKIIRDSSFVLHQPASRVIFDNEENTIRTMIGLSNNKMTIQEDVYDGRTYEYEKMN